MALSEARIEEIAEVLREAARGTNKLCVLTGAGVSKSAGIGLAEDFVRRIAEGHPNLFKKACVACGEGRQPSYADCMAALPPAMQVNLIREDIEKSKINWAHIGIARLEAGGMLDTILTTNFDPLASRACALFNRFPAIYDLAGLRDQGANQIGFDRSYLRDSAIFHLHGQHTGFLLLNTEDKLQAQANRIKPVIDAVMQGKPVIIAGYSGENDPLVDKIAALAPFNHGLFWVCHNDQDPAPNVCEKLLSLPDCHLVRSKPADIFFTELANALSLDAPRFLGDPFSHMLDVIEAVRPYADLGPGKGSDLLESARSRLNDARDKHAEISPEGSEIAKLMAKGAFQEVWDSFAAKAKELPDADRDEVAWAAIMLGTALADQARDMEGAEADRLYAEAGENYAAALAIKPDMHEALYNWGVALSDQARGKMGVEADRLYAEAGEKYAAALAIKPDKHEALDN